MGGSRTVKRVGFGTAWSLRPRPAFRWLREGAGEKKYIMKKKKYRTKYIAELGARKHHKTREGGGGAQHKCESAQHNKQGPSG
mgnify:CR=1 FL=1